MKKFIFILTVLLSVSCQKEEIFEEEIVVEEINCNGNVRCLGVYNVEIWYDHDDNPKNLIVAKDGYSAKLGELLTFQGTSVPGWKFIGWRKMTNSYCEYSPLVDEDDPTIAYVYMHEKYMGNCNIGPMNVRIVAEYIKTLD